MSSRSIRRFAVGAAAAGLLVWPIQSAGAQPTQPATGQAPAARSRAVTPAPVQVTVDDPNADRTRGQLMELLEKYPPTVGQVLKLDSSLLSNADYLATYPSLAVFLSQHPEIPRNPEYYFRRVRAVAEFIEPRRSDAYLMWNELLGWMGGLSMGIIIALSFGWLIRQVVDYRRWARLSKVQAEAHTKLLDRLTSNAELLAYVQSSAGSRFLESAPIALDPGTKRIAAPFNRILWSAQAGVVLTAAGLGLNYVSGRFVNTDASQPLFALGVLAIALGLGFVVSTAVSYLLSARLGLLEQAAKDEA
jgi:hypothetical protein